MQPQQQCCWYGAPYIVGCGTVRTATLLDKPDTGYMLYCNHSSSVARQCKWSMASTAITTAILFNRLSMQKTTSVIYAEQTCKHMPVVCLAWSNSSFCTSSKAILSIIDNGVNSCNASLVTHVICVELTCKHASCMPSMELQQEPHDLKPHCVSAALVQV